MRRSLYAAFLGTVLVAAPVPSHADPCSGSSPFGDVAASDSFCSNTEWLANRGITLGCGGGNFCPFSAVTRAQMALFMNRLAVALAPTTVTATQTLGATDFGSGIAICQTADVSTGAFAKVVSATSTVNPFAPTAGTGLGARLVYSINGGTTWIPFGSAPPWTTFATLYAGQSPSSDFT